MIHLRKLAEQQKEQRALKIRNKILKETHDIKLAESLSPITKKLDETSKKLVEVIKKSQPKTPQLAIENTPQPAIENTPQPIEDNEGRVYDVELESTLNKMTDNTGFFKTHYDPQHGWMLNSIPVKSSGATEVEIKKQKYNITSGIQKVFTDKSYDSAKSMSDTEKSVFRDILQKTNYYTRIPTKGKPSGRDRYIRYDLDNDVAKILNLDIKLK